MYNVVFYSRYCNLCIDLLNILKNEKMIDYFRVVCIDNDLNNSPVNMVPTMIVKGIPKPLQGKETIEWVKQTKFITQRRIMDMKKNMVVHNMMKIMMQNKKNGPAGFTDEMKGFSDTFAYTNVDQAQPHSFCGYKEEDKHTIFTAKEVNKMNKHQLHKGISELEKNRAHEDQRTNEVMEKKQLMELIKHDREEKSKNLNLSELRSENNETRRQRLIHQQLQEQQRRGRRH